MIKIVLSKKSLEDLDKIFDYGKEKFGKQQASIYLKSINDYFKLISNNPEIGKKRNEIKKGLYSFPHYSHIVFYRVLNDYIRIVRVLHGSRDLIKFL